MQTVHLCTTRKCPPMRNKIRLTIYAVAALSLIMLTIKIMTTLTLNVGYPRLTWLTNMFQEFPTMPDPCVLNVGYPRLTWSPNMFREFPTMPNPCVGTRRQTGVEDLLCQKAPEFSPAFKNPCWYEGTNLRCLPYFYLIGNSKCGTTDFFKRLYLHPDIIPNNGLYGKETLFWSLQRMNVVGLNGKHINGATLKTFISQFKSKEIQKIVDPGGYHKLITGHGDPMDFYEMFAWPLIPQNDPNAYEPIWTWPHLVRHVNRNRNVKLLLMLREPVERLYSHYLFRRFGTSAQSFHEHVVSSIEVWKLCTSERSIRACIYSKYISRQFKANIYGSFYSVHLKEWLRVFPRDQILIFRTEDYAKDMINTFKQVFKFLNITTPDDNILEQMGAVNRTRETAIKKTAGPMKNETRKLLLELYKPYTKELAEMLGDRRYLWED